MISPHSRRARRSLAAALLLAGTVLTGCSTTGGGWKMPSWSGKSSQDKNRALAAAPPAPAPQVAAAPPPATSAPRDARKVAAANLEEDSPNLATMMANGRLQEKAGEWDKARLTYEKAMKRFPNDAAPYHRMGVVADQQRRYLEAEQMFSEAIRRNPKNAEQFNDLGYCYFLQGQLDRAEASLLKAVQLEPKNARFENNYGLVLAHQGRVEEALQRFRMAGSEADAQYNLAFIYASQDKIDLAKTCFRRALAADPQHEAARRAIQSFELYDQLPPEQRDFELANSGQRWVPYREPGDPGFASPGAPATGGGGPNGSAPGAFPVQQAAHAATLGPQRAAGAAAKTSYLESRGGFNANGGGR